MQRPYETDGGDITFTGAVDLAVNTTVDSDDDDTGNAGDITFTSKLRLVRWDIR